MLKIGICGYGTVGQSFIEHLRVHSDKIKSNISEEYEISLIADRSIDKKEHDKDIAVTKDAMEMALNPAIDIIIELMGGIDIPYKLITSAIHFFSLEFAPINCIAALNVAITSFSLADIN